MTVDSQIPKAVLWISPTPSSSLPPTWVHTKSWKPGDAKAEADVQAALRRKFRPEFLNRIDDIVIFDALKREDMEAIFHIQMRRMRRLLEDRQPNP